MSDVQESLPVGKMVSKMLILLVLFMCLLVCPLVLGLESFIVLLLLVMDTLSGLETGLPSWIWMISSSDGTDSSNSDFQDI